MSPVSYFDDPNPVDVDHNYVELADLKQTLELSGETFADEDLKLAINAASRGIDNVANRRFWLDADASQVRYYTPDDAWCLRIDDLAVVTSVKTDEDGDGFFENTWTQNSDYLLTPLNAAADDRPWTTIETHPTGRYSFPCGYPRSVEVTGKFGWAETPYAVKQATVVLATKLMRRAREAPFGVVTAGLELGGIARIARTDPDVMFLIGPYIRGRVTVA